MGKDPYAQAQEASDQRYRKIVVGVLATPVALLAFVFLFWPQLFPVSYVKFFGTSGQIEDVARSPKGLVLFESVHRGRATNKGTSFRVERFLVVDPATGATLAGPWVVPPVKWLGVIGNLALDLDDDDGLQVRSLETGEVTLTMAQLGAVSPQLAGHLTVKSAHFMVVGGRLYFKNNQALLFSFDPVSGDLQQVKEVPRPEPEAPLAAPLPEWTGGDRRSLKGSQTTLLQADWLTLTGTRQPIAAGSGWVAKHWDHLGGSSGAGLILSSVDTGGNELWRYPVGGDWSPELVQLVGDTLLILAGGDDAVLIALDPATGKARWLLR